jgi:Protein of unknown function (Hypoth_ymh)
MDHNMAPTADQPRGGRDPDRLPDSSDPNGPCPRCGRPSNFMLRGTAPVTYRADVFYAASVDGDRRVADQQLVVMECAYCQQNIVVIEEELHDGERGKKSGRVSWRGIHWWPPPGSGAPGPVVPKTISKVHGTLDRDAAIRYLTEYCELVSKAQGQLALTKDRRATMKAVEAHLAGVNQVLRGLASDLEPIYAHGLRDHVAALPRVRRALVLLNGWREMTDHQWTGGGPALPLKLLDPVVSQVAPPLWNAGKYRQAVSDAATSLNSFAQNQIGRRDISDKDLMGQAFSDKDPEPGKARLRCPGNPHTETVKAQQEGARAFAIGTFQAIRNPAHHLTGDGNPVTAFHHLVALSQVAHWFRDWDVLRYAPPPPDFSAMQAAQTISAQAQAPKVSAQRQDRSALPRPTE